MTHISDLQTNVEDLVNITLVNKNGAVGQIQIDMVSPDYRRGLELVYKDAIFFWDYTTGVLEYRNNGE